MTPRARLILAGLSCLLLAACGGSEDDGSSADAGRGEPAAVADTAIGSCSDVVESSAGGADHVEPGTEMEYAGVPPTSGNHWATWEDIVKPVYTAEERPDLGQLVHSQEHGWTIVWFDETIDPADLEPVAAEVAAAGAPKVVFMPWTEDDGEAFPDGAHIAMTHWGVEGGETEYRQFCEAAEAEAVLAFAGRYPSTDSREPNAP